MFVVVVVGSRNKNYRVIFINKQYFLKITYQECYIAEATCADFYYLEDTFPMPQFFIWG